MVWKIEFDEVALKQLNKLPYSIKIEILSYLKSITEKSNNPRNFGKPLLYEKKGLWRYRVDKYRIICQLENEKCIILVVKIGKRDKVYG